MSFKFNPFMPRGLLYLNSLDRPFPMLGESGYFLSSCFVEISEFNENNVDPDQMMHFLASNLGLHCLLMSFLWDARLKWVNI